MVKISTFTFLGAAVGVTAFPHYVQLGERDLDNLRRSIDTVLENVDIKALHAESRDKIRNKRQNTFSESQLVDVTGVHAWQAPTADQTRGPCPGLNVLANHGYFDRSGKTSLVESISALTSVMGMGIDTATALVVYSIALIGDPVALTWSIGRNIGSSTLLPGVLSPPGGIDQSHNNYESDASVTREDSYLNNGDVWSVGIENFKQLYSLQPDTATADYNSDILTQHRNWTIQKSISTNPYFFFAPFSGLVVATAAHNFVPHFFSNYSAEYPNGRLNQANLKSFFSITGDTVDTLKWVPGYERIPDNWYHAPGAYTLVNVVADVLDVITKVPAAGTVGGNTGKVNTFTGVDVADLTGGVLNAATLLEGNNLICFALAASRAALPSVLGGVVSLLSTVDALLDSALGGILSDLTCPAFNTWNLGLFSEFPGSG